RTDAPAGTAPLSPKVNQHRHGGLLDLIAKRRFSYGSDRHGNLFVVRRAAASHWYRKLGKRNRKRQDAEPSASDPSQQGYSTRLIPALERVPRPALGRRTVARAVV